MGQPRLALVQSPWELTVPDRIDLIEKAIAELRADIRERDAAQTTRYHKLRSDVAGVNLLVEKVGRNERRIEKLEDLNVELLADRLARLSGQVEWLNRIGVGAIVTVFTSLLVLVAIKYL